MDEQEIPSHLSSLADLDRYALTYDGKSVDVLFGHAVSFFFENGHQQAVRQRALDTMADYYRSFQEEINFYFPYGARRPQPIGEVDVVDYLQRHLDSLPQDDAVGLDDDVRFAAELFGLKTKGYTGDATPWFCSLTCNPPSSRWSGWECFLPASWPEAAGYDAYLAKVLEWCELLRPAHGTAGLSVIFDSVSLRSSDGSLPFAAIKRHPGLDYPDNGRWRAFVRRKPGRLIRTINWLTILDEEFIAALDGLDKIRETLGESCPVHPFEGGIVIQAGERPQLGDVNRGEIPEEYRKVASLTRDIRFEGFTGRNGLLTVPRSLDSVEETLKWLQRFD